MLSWKAPIRKHVLVSTEDSETRKKISRLLHVHVCMLHTLAVLAPAQERSDAFVT